MKNSILIMMLLAVALSANASILLVVLFIGMNIAFGRFAARHGMRHHAAYGCEYPKADSTISK